MSASKPASIDQLSSLITKGNGFSNANLYNVILPRWEASSTNPRDMSLLCKSVELPRINVASVPREINMSRTEVAHGFAVSPITMTFRILNDAGVRKYFETWMSQVVPNWNNPDIKSHTVGYYDDYVRDIEIRQLKKELNVPLFEKTFDLPLPSFIKRRLTNLGPINFGGNADTLGIGASLGFDGLEIDLNLAGSNSYVCKLFEAYPENIAYTSLSDDNSNSISEVTVTFKYKNWVGTSEEDNSLLGKIEREITGKLYEVRDNIEDKAKTQVAKSFGIKL